MMEILESILKVKFVRFSLKSNQNSNRLLKIELECFYFKLVGYWWCKKSWLKFDDEKK